MTHPNDDSSRPIPGAPSPSKSDESPSADASPTSSLGHAAPTDDKIAEVLALADEICNGTITPSQARRCEMLLADDPVAQRAYGDYLFMHADMHWLDRGHVDAAAQDRGTSPQTAPPRLPNDEPSVALPIPRQRRSLIRRYAWVAALAAAVLFAVGGWTVRGQWQRTRASVADLENRDANVAKITGSLNCRWANQPDGRVLGYGSSLYAGDQLNLAEGVAELTFDGGARVILQAPAIFDVESYSDSVLHQGRLTVCCPTGAQGFRVTAGSLVVVDRGTEFGISADENGDAEVHVFRGLAEAQFPMSQDGPVQTVHWRENKIVRYENALHRVRELEDSKVTFVRSLSPTLGPVRGLLAAEDFDYPAGRLGGQNGGFGWGGPWEDMSIEVVVPDSNAIMPGSLRRGVALGSGNHAALYGDFNRIRRMLGTSFSGVFDTAGFVEERDGARVIGRDGKTLYLGFIQHVDITDQVFYGFELNRGDGNQNRVLCIGHGAAKSWTDGPVRTPDNDAGSTPWAVTSESNGEGLSSKHFGDLGPETSDVTVIVVKIKFGIGDQDTVTVYRNPSSLWDEGKCEPVVVGQGDFSFDRIGLANFGGDKTFSVDGIRIGTSFSGVTRPVWRSESESESAYQADLETF